MIAKFLRRRLDWGSLAVFLLSLSLYLVILPHRIDVLRPLDIDIPVPTGDEPYYLEIAHSLVYDHDIELTNNEEALDYYRFYPSWLPPHQSKTAILGHYSKHSLGLPLIISPWYWVGDQFWLGEVTGSRAMSALFMGVLGALLAANLYLLVKDVTGSVAIGWVVSLAMIFTSPLLSYSFLLFPALPAALIVAYSYRHLRLQSGDPVHSLIVGFGLSFLPWLHPVMALLSMTFAIAYLTIVRPMGRSLALFGTPLAASATLVLAHNLWLYATPMPNLQDHAGIWAEGIPVGFVGSLIDQQWGLLIYAPLYALAAAGAYLSLHPSFSNRLRDTSATWLGPGRELVLLCCLSAPYLLFIFSYRQWWGEWCPPARYLVPALPLSAVLLGRALMFGPPLRALFAVLSLPSLLTGALFVVFPRMMYNHPTGQAEALLWLQGILGIQDLVFAWPTVVAPSFQTPCLSAAWLLGFGCLLMTALLLERR